MQICATCVPVVMWIQISSRLGVEGIGAREVVQSAVDLLEVPGVGDRSGASTTLVSGDTEAMSPAPASPALLPAGVQRLQASDDEVLVLADRDGGPPLFPAAAAAAAVELGAEKADDHLFMQPILSDRLTIYFNIF